MEPQVQSIYLIYTGLMVYTILNLIYSKKHVLFIRLTYGKHMLDMVHTSLSKNLVRHLESPNKLFSMLFRNAEDRIETIFGFSLCAISL